MGKGSGSCRYSVCVATDDGVGVLLSDVALRIFRTYDEVVCLVIESVSDEWRATGGTK